MDIQKAFEEFVEKEWHDGHEPQGIDDQYVEEVLDDEEVEEARTYLDRKDEKKKKGLTPMSQKKKRWGSGGYGKGEEAEIDELVAPGKKSATGYTLYHKDFSSAMQHAYDHAKKKGHVVDPKEIDDKVATGPKKPSKGKVNRYALKAGRKTVQIQVTNLDNKAYELNMYIEGVEPIPEGFKDLPPHLQKLVKKIEKKQKDWNKQNPEAKIQTLVYNPETGKPDIVVKETMKLEDTVKQVLTGEPKLEEHCGVCDEQGIEEDSDKDEPGTQGDMAVYQKKRKEVAKKFGVKSCSELEGAEKKACFSALDKAHVADHEEQVELEKMRKEEKKEQKSFSKLFSHVKSLMQSK